MGRKIGFYWNCGGVGTKCWVGCTVK